MSTEDSGNQHEPFCGEEEFQALLEEMVSWDAPQVFAVVEELGERADARIAAWGLAFEDHVEVIAVDGGLRMSLCSAESALRGFGRAENVSARLIWAALEHTQSDQTRSATLSLVE